MVTRLPCPRCKRDKVLRRLPPNFKCADIICDFCGYLAQVKTSTQKDVDVLPSSILGAAWGPQSERMASGIYFPLFIVLVTPNRRKRAIYFLPSDLQSESMFVKRQPLSQTARRAGWVGYLIKLNQDGAHTPVRLSRSV
jgi:hypothetical protein